MNYKELSAAIVEEIRTCLEKTDEEQLEKAVELVSKAPRVFTAGAGRTGLEVSAFTMRLMHIGHTAYRVGEVVTPAIGEGDLLVLCSGSGETKTMLEYAKTAKAKGAKILLFTTKEVSSIASLADQIVLLHAKAAKNTDGNVASIQPMSNLFVQSLCLTMDTIIIGVMKKENIDESKMKHLHANLE
ncbi:MAG: 6-phospho-3-hexuloisomerase [Erysipelotrichaceae bacterium]|nr:6-phospho-3-hexuloisomerase [Erysipelotrichaceae bacterium]